MLSVGSEVVILNLTVKASERKALLVHCDARHEFAFEVFSEEGEGGGLCEGRAVPYVYTICTTSAYLRFIK